MEVILLERIEKLGQMGDVVKVKNGYARNYLLPQEKALRSTKANLEYFETQKVQLEAINLKRKEEAESVASKMADLKVLMIRQAAETGQLYGSVTVRDVCDAIKSEGFNIERKQVKLNQPIKELGIYDIDLSLHADVAQTITVSIARSEDDAKRLEKAAAKAEKEDLVKDVEKDLAEAKTEEVKEEATEE
jgi:large subunit ribosomal protein L9